MSTGFSESAMTSKMDQLNNTMQSIQTLSLWLLHHRKHSKRIAHIWHKEVMKEEKFGRLLSLVYLANDVIQNSRKKWPAFQEHFYNVLNKSFAHVAKHADDRTLNSLKRVINVWKERGVYGNTAIEKFKSSIKSQLTGMQLSVFTDELTLTPVSRDEEQIQPQTPPLSSGTSLFVASPSYSRKRKRKIALEESSTTSESTAAPTTAELIVALRNLEEPASADGETRQRIASFPEAVANPVFLRQVADGEKADELHRKIKDAEPVVSNYCKRLAEEMEQRRATQKMLIDYLGAVKQKAENTQQLLNRFREKREKLKSDRIGVYKHYESLPDLSKFPNISQLNPLPPAGELFDSSRK